MQLYHISSKGLQISFNWVCCILTMSSILRMLRTVSAASCRALVDTSSGWTTFSSRMLVMAPCSKHNAISHQKNSQLDEQHQVNPLCDTFTHFILFHSINNTLHDIYKLHNVTLENTMLWKLDCNW